MSRYERPPGGDIETYRKYNSPENKAEREQALTQAEAEAQVHGSEAVGVNEAVRESQED